MFIRSAPKVNRGTLPLLLENGIHSEIKGVNVMAVASSIFRILRKVTVIYNN